MNETPSFKWASRAVSVLHSMGITAAVISPGSRNTALTLALVTHPGIRCYSAIDERSAAFIALGISKINRVPTLLCCTSGTAGANYLPAVIEAYQSSIPLIIATADRPTSLQNKGASQTIKQQQLFGSFVIHEQQMPEAEDLVDETAWKHAKHLLREALTASYKSGPVHLNFPFNKPFKPTSAQLSAYREDTSRQSSPTERPKANYRPSDSFARIEHPSIEWINAPEAHLWYFGLKQPVLVVGAEPTPIQWHTLLPLLLKHPNARIIMETGASLFGWDFEGASLIKQRLITGWKSTLQTNKVASNEINGILRLGKECISPELNQWMNTYGGSPQLRLQTHEAYENTTEAPCKHMSPEEQLSWSSLLNQSISWPASSPKWHAAWDDSQRVQPEKNRAYFESTDAMTDGAVFHRLAEIIPRDVFIFYSNSFPVRDQELFYPKWSKSHRQVSQRGAAGIDGICSTAIGVSIGLNEPGVVISGDIAFLYDSNALLSGRLLEKPLLIVVMNNGGGSIFKMLPVYKEHPEFIEWFQTAQHVDIEHLAKAHGIAYKGVQSHKELMDKDSSEWICLALDDSVEKMAAFGANKIRIVEFFTDDEASLDERKLLSGTPKAKGE
jgi:2-succinyl-5-enolpyruvyl-6-hydroxy-3-cyclohexene-1-carboxylate synthase